MKSSTGEEVGKMAEAVVEHNYYFYPNNTASASEEILHQETLSSSSNHNISNHFSGNSTSPSPYEVPTGLIILLALLYGSISLLAVLGNALVILIIVKNRRMHTVTNIFIANLAVADVIIGMFSIPFQFQAALLQRWVLANFMCSLAPMVQVISVNVSFHGPQRCFCW